MPAKLLSGVLDGAPEISALRIEHPLRLFGELDNAVEFRASWVYQEEMAGAIDVASEMAARMAVERAFGGAIDADPEWTGLLAIPQAFGGSMESALDLAAGLDFGDLGFAGILDVEGEMAAGMVVVRYLAGTFDVDLETRAGFGFTEPVFEPLLDGQMPGVVNVAANPSVELDLDDWTSANTLTRVVDGTAWVGEAHATWTIPAGVIGSLTVTSQDALGLPVAGLWVAHVALDLAAGLRLTAALSALHSDGAATNGPTGEISGPTNGWQPWLVPPVPADPARILRRLDLQLALDNSAGAGPVTVRLDGVQFSRYADGAEHYADGSGGALYEWLGPAHASPSVRYPGVL